MIVLRRKNGDIIWFDAVTQYNATYSASVTKHPVATGGFVSDHTTTDNVVLQISGIFSDADFNINRQLVEVNAADGSNISRDKQYTNKTQTVYPVQIDERSGGINQILPQVIAQFTKDTIPVAFVTEQDKAKTALAVKQNLIDMWKNREEFQVLDIESNVVVEQFSPCIFTNLSFSEDPNTGEGVFPVMTIEQVVFTNLQEISVKVKTVNKGRKSASTESKIAETPPDHAPRTYTSESVSSWKRSTGSGSETQQ